MKIEIYKKNSKNIYNPTVVNLQEINICSVLKNNQTSTVLTSFVSAFYPPFMEQAGHVIHPCPYTVINHSPITHAHD
jgi:hypothetical protein